MDSWLTRTLAGAVLGAVLALALTSSGDPRRHAPMIVAQEPEPEGNSRVSDEEFKLFVGVYSEMQRDHSLKIDSVLASRDMSLADFRALERRIQMQETLIRKVREALLEEAKKQGASLQPLPLGD